MHANTQRSVWINAGKKDRKTTAFSLAFQPTFNLLGYKDIRSMRHTEKGEEGMSKAFFGLREI